MSIDVKQLRKLIKEVLSEIDLYSEDAEELLMLTAATESHLGTYIEQINGPALGIFQMEPDTEKDIWKNYLKYKPERKDVVERFDTKEEDDMKWNFAYQIIMARVHYLRVKEQIPNKKDVKKMAEYYKKYFNTPLGKGSVQEAMSKYEKYVLNG